MSYRIEIDPKSMKAARFISRLQKHIQKALVASGKTQQEVADVLGVGRSVINRRLKGSANLTARSMAEFAYAFDKDLVIEFVDKTPTAHSNLVASTDNIVKLQQEGLPISTGTIDFTNEVSVERTAS